MSDTLSWDFEIAGDTEGVDDTTDALVRMERQLRQVNWNLGRMYDASAKVTKAHDEHKKHAEETGGALKRLREAALEPLIKKFKEYAEFEFVRKGVDALIEAPGEIIEKLKELGEEMVNVAAKTERTESAFGLLFGGDEGKENLEYAEQIAKYTEFTDDHLKSAMLSLGKVGFKGESMDRALAAAHDMAAFSANPEEGFSEAIASLSRIKRTGHVDNRVLGGLGIGETDFLGELAKRTGKSAASLKKAMEKGTVDTEAAIETLYSMIAKKTGKDLGGAGVEMSKSMSAMLTHLRDLPEQYFQKLDKSPGFEQFKDKLSHVLEDLDPDSPKGRRIFGALERVFAGLSEIIGSIDWAGLVTSAADAIETLEEMFLEALTFIPGETGSKASYALNNMKQGRHARDVERDDEAVNVQRAKQHGTTPAFERAARQAEDDADLDSLGPTTASAGEAVGEGMGDAVEKGIRKKTRTHSPSDAFRDVGLDLAAGLALGFGAGMDGVAAPSGALPASGGGAGARVQVHLSAPITVNGAGGDGGSVAQQIQVHLTSILPDALTAALERVGMEQGA